MDAETIRLAADELPVAIWMGKVPSGEVVYTNRAFREVLGIEPPEGAARGAFVEPYGVHTPDGAVYPEDRMPFERVIAARADVVIDDLVIHRRDGRRVHLRVFAKPLFDASGELTHVLEAFTDISREVEAERARAEGDRRLALAQRLESIGQLAAGIAHDFNNLLTVTKLVVSRLRATEPDADRRDALAQVDAVTESAVALVRNLLGFAGRRRHVAVPVVLDDVASSMFDIAARTFDRRIRVRLDLGAKTGVVEGDPSQLEQVVMNLLLNARDAIPGEGEVVVRTRETALGPEAVGGAAPGRYVVLDVVDTGTGIDPANRERIFEPYFTTKTRGAVKGTGLGLATVHGVAQSHGGFVTIADTSPRGTTMRVAFPAAAAAARDAALGAGGERAAGSETGLPRGDGSVVLVVDDEPLVRSSMTASLRALGYEVLVASDGREALAVFEREKARIDAVVLDMMMPGMSGREVYRALHAARPDTPVVISTGCVDDDETRDLMAEGACGWLPKPYDDAGLAATLARALDRRVVP